MDKGRHRGGLFHCFFEGLHNQWVLPCKLFSDYVFLLFQLTISQRRFQFNSLYSIHHSSKSALLHLHKGSFIQKFLRGLVGLKLLGLACHSPAVSTLPLLSQVLGSLSSPSNKLTDNNHIESSSFSQNILLHPSIEQIT